MYAVLKISYMNVHAEEKPDSDIRKKRLLVAIDTSGSMGALNIVIQEVLQVIFAFEELEPNELSVEYLLFNVDDTKEFSFSNEPGMSMEEKIRTGQEMVQYHGETSVYKGLEKVGEWVKEKNEQAGDVPIGLLVFSDLFSSRDKNGDPYSWKMAENEQSLINTWSARWGNLTRKNSLNALFIYWESMTPGESIDKTLDHLKGENEDKNGDISTGYQVKLKGLEKSELLVDAIRDRENINPKAEQEIVEASVCHILKVITEEKNIYWKDAGITQQPEMSIQFRIPKDKRILIRIDKEQGKSGTEILSARNEKVYPIKRVLEGKTIELYFVEKIEGRVIKVQTEQEGCQVYYLVIP